MTSWTCRPVRCWGSTFRFVGAGRVPDGSGRQLPEALCEPLGDWAARIAARKAVANALALLCGAQGIATLAIDLNRTHATNPQWPGHARFHPVWRASSAALLAGLEMVLLFIRGPYDTARFNLAAAFASVPMVGFLLALVGRKLYRGALSNRNGIPPAKFRFSHRQLMVDLNLMAVTAGFLCPVALICTPAEFESGPDLDIGIERDRNQFDPSSNT